MRANRHWQLSRTFLLRKLEILPWLADKRLDISDLENFGAFYTNTRLVSKRKRVSEYKFATNRHYSRLYLVPTLSFTLLQAAKKCA